MSRYRMSDGTIVDTDRAARSWDERQEWDGRNHVSVHTGDQWAHERLYLSSKGRFYLVIWSDWQGSGEEATYVSETDAAAWLLLNGSELPEELKEVEESVVE